MRDKRRDLYHVMCPDTCSKKRLMSISKCCVCQKKFVTTTNSTCKAFWTFLKEDVTISSWLEIRTVRFKWDLGKKERMKIEVCLLVVNIRIITLGTFGSSFDGFNPVANGVTGPLTITLPRYCSNFWARFWLFVTLNNSGFLRMKSVVTVPFRKLSCLSTFKMKEMLVWKGQIHDNCQHFGILFTVITAYVHVLPRNNVFLP